MNKTVKYYKDNSKKYIDSTLNCDMSVTYGFFERYIIKKNPCLLDIGFGSGRDSLYFMSKGYKVTSIDPVDEFIEQGCKLGLANVIKMTAQDIVFNDEFDCIWACASLLHVKEDELNDVFKRCQKALKDNGVMYCSFKYGEFVGDVGDRYFVFANEKSIAHYLVSTGLSMIDCLITRDVRQDRKNEKWLNIILRKE